MEFGYEVIQPADFLRNAGGIFKGLAGRVGLGPLDVRRLEQSVQFSDHGPEFRIVVGYGAEVNAATAGTVLHAVAMRGSTSIAAGAKSS